MVVQPASRAIARQGSRCAVTKSKQPLTKSNRKIVEERDSSEKLVDGMINEMTWSWSVEKSSMLFWRSRIFRKKSLLISAAGFTVAAGANGGPWMEYESVNRLDEGGGCRTRKAGTMTKRSTMAIGRIANR